MGRESWLELVLENGVILITKSAIGLDLSLSSTGMCFIPSNWDGRYRTLVTKSISIKRQEAFGDPCLLAEAEVVRYHRIAGGVAKFVKDSGTRDVCVEQYRFSAMKGNGQSFQSSSITKLAELGGIVKSQIFLSCYLAVVPVVASSARKWFTGGLKKDNPKQQMADYLSRMNFNFNNTDEMDAFVVANFHYDMINGLTSRFSNMRGQRDIESGVEVGFYERSE